MFWFLVLIGGSSHLILVFAILVQNNGQTGGYTDGNLKMLLLSSLYSVLVSDNSLFLCHFRTVYHCPFCNLCRLGNGLGIDFFHCMTCNCCLGMKLVDHKCREKGLETNCPICCDFLFTSSATVRALPCGHFMHSACFQVYYFVCLFRLD